MLEYVGPLEEFSEVSASQSCSLSAGSLCIDQL